MDKRYQDTGAAGWQWGAGHGGPGDRSRAEDETPYSGGLRCGTLVLTGFPAPPPKDRSATSPTTPAKGDAAGASY